LNVIEVDVGAEVVTPEQLAHQYGGRVLRFAAMVSRNQADTEDLAQDALLKAMRALPQFDSHGPRSVEAWLWRIVINVARDAGRAASRRHIAWERLLVSQQRAMVEDVESLALRKIRDADLLDQVQRLPKRSRTLLALRFGADLSYDEMAALLGDSPSALRQAVRRALRRLRDRLEESSHE
jgi:RNA polymerase sigma-70 factor (ECF subfamily)